jgi:type I restriction enzyme M protein
LPRYIDGQAREDRQDIAGHLQGGIPADDIDALHAYWEVCPKLKAALFRPRRPGYFDLAVDKAAIKQSIYGHPEFASFTEEMNGHFAAWAKRAAKKLKALEPGFHPKDVIASLSDGLLDHYAGKPLIDAYAVYQHLMDYWAETMQDDCYLIAADGWKAEPERVIEVKKNKDGKITKEVDKGWLCDLVPKALIVARYFAKEQEATDALAAELDTVSASIAELEEEHSGEDAPFSGFDKINKASVNERLKEIGGEKDSADEIVVLKQWLKLNVREAEIKKQLKEAEAKLDAKALAQYPKLSEAEIKSLVVDDKWLAALDRKAHGEMGRVSQALTARVRELADRYELPLPELAKQARDLEKKVNAHLTRMGFAA